MTSSQKSLYTQIRLTVTTTKGINPLYSPNYFHKLAYSPETILLLRSLSTVEAQYLARSTNKINEAVGQAFSGVPRTPGTSEGVNVARIVVNELDAARFDPLLVRAVAKNTATCLENITKRLENLVGLACHVLFRFSYMYCLIAVERKGCHCARWGLRHTAANFECQSS